VKCQRETPGIYKLYKRKAVRSVFFVHFFRAEKCCPGSLPLCSARVAEALQEHRRSSTELSWAQRAAGDRSATHTERWGLGLKVFSGLVGTPL